MSETEGTLWIITTFSFLATTIISWLVTISFWMFMKAEGRFFFKRNFDKKGIDVLRHEPLSNRIRLITVKWNGQYFQHGKEMILFSIEKLINPDDDAKRYYNEVIGKMCTWADSKRPVLIATDTMSHLITPDLLALAARTKKNEEYETAKKQIPNLITKIKNQLTKVDPTNENVEPEIVSYLETMKPDDLSEFMEDISARDAWQVYQVGKRVNELERNLGLEVGTAAKIAISLVGIGAVLLIGYLVATGQMTEIINTVRT